MAWRPHDWENLYSGRDIECTDRDTLGFSIEDAFEEGADVGITAVLKYIEENLLGQYDFVKHGKDSWLWQEFRQGVMG